MEKRNNQFLPIGILAGGIIGAGVFSLPFVFYSSGLSVGFGYLLLAALGYCVIHLMYADIMLRTEGDHRFVGYLGRYLGRPFFVVGIYMAIFEMLFTLTIYLVLSERFTSLLVPGGPALAKVLIFWLFGGMAIFLSLRRLALSESVVTAAILAIIGVIFGLGVAHPAQLLATQVANSFSGLLLPLPAILFALSGRVAIPSLVQYFGRKEGRAQAKVISRAIVLGTLLPAAAYAVFVLGVLGLSHQVSPDAISGLIGMVPPLLLSLIGILGWLSLWSSYILVGLDIESTLRYDVRLPGCTSALLVFVVPLLLYIFGLRNFLQLIGFVGGVLLALEGVFVIAMWLRLNRTSTPILFRSKKQPFLIGVTLLLFILALISVTSVRF